ncbi:unnamed protein product [Rotaria sp. Silwood1]|nr:unnamed protein product [Rotaria sp. Silwood1]
MQRQLGYIYTNGPKEFGNFHLVPDWTSLRLMSWQNNAATVMCDVYDDKENDHVLVPYAPHSILRKQIEAASKPPYKVLTVSELEYYMYENSYRDARAENYEKLKLKTLGDYHRSYHLLQTASEEKYNEAFRYHLKASGIPVENSKREAGIGQHELNIKFSDVLSMADQLGVSVTFMAKPFIDTAGSGCHIHLSMANASGGKKAFTADSNSTDSNDKSYHLLQTASEEKNNEAFRYHLKVSGIPVENSKREAGIGQHELNIKFSDVLSTADQLGVSVTFMAKPFIDTAGSGCHIHLSMVNASGGKNAFTADSNSTDSNDKCSPLFKYFLAGWLKYAPDVTVFYAPTINSYKRLMNASWAPTNLAWSYDNRMTAFRVVGKSQSTRIECRLPGADCNTYLAFAASLASGLRVIADQLEPPPIFEADIDQTKELPQVARTLKEAIHAFENSTFEREVFGEDVVNHYLNFYRQEQAACETSVTDWERHRYFEQI